MGDLPTAAGYRVSIHRVASAAFAARKADPRTRSALAGHMATPGAGWPLLALLTLDPALTASPVLACSAEPEGSHHPEGSRYP